MIMDLAGVADSDESFSEIPTSSHQHLAETAERAVRTMRGTIPEYPDSYVDLAHYLGAQGTSIPAAVVAASTQEDLELDPRIARATVTIGAADRSGRVPFSITIRTVEGAIVETEGTA